MNRHSHHDAPGSTGQQDHPWALQTYVPGVGITGLSTMRRTERPREGTAWPLESHAGGASNWTYPMVGNEQQAPNPGKAGSDHTIAGILRYLQSGDPTQLSPQDIALSVKSVEPLSSIQSQVTLEDSFVSGPLPYYPKDSEGVARGEGVVEAFFTVRTITGPAGWMEWDKLVESTEIGVNCRTMSLSRLCPQLTGAQHFVGPSVLTMPKQVTLLDTAALNNRRQMEDPSRWELVAHKGSPVSPLFLAEPLEQLISKFCPGVVTMTTLCGEIVMSKCVWEVNFFEKLSSDVDR